MSARVKLVVAGMLFGTFGLFLLAGCGSSGGTDPGGATGDDSAQASIGPQGGTVEIDDEVALDVPVGALGGTVDFTIEEDSSPANPPAGKKFVSHSYDIEPDGTVFLVPATVTIDYDESDVGRGDEDDIVIYMDDGGGWEALSTCVDTEGNQASADVSHLTDFVAAVDSNGGDPADGVFAALLVHRGIVPIGEGFVVTTDIISARFDSTVSPCQPIEPIRADSVECNSLGLPWDPMSSSHRIISIMTPLIDLGQNYEFVVTDRGQVPPLTCDIDFPDYAPYLTEPSMMETVELSGFTVTWEDGHGGDATLSLALVPGDTTVTGVYINTANDGSHTFTAGDLSGLNPGAHAIALNFYTTESIDAQGYDSESFIQAKVTSAVDVYLE